MGEIKSPESAMPKKIPKEQMDLLFAEKEVIPERWIIEISTGKRDKSGEEEEIFVLYEKGQWWIDREQVDFEKVKEAIPFSQLGSLLGTDRDFKILWEKCQKEEKESKK